MVGAIDRRKTRMPLVESDVGSELHDGGAERVLVRPTAVTDRLPMWAFNADHAFGDGYMVNMCDMW